MLGYAFETAMMLMIFLAIILALIVALSFFVPDHPSEKELNRRMVVWVDPDSGCHYVAYRFGGIAPRIDATGNHICTDVGK